MPRQPVEPANRSGAVAPPARWGVWPRILLGITAVWVAAMLASTLHWRFLDVVAGNRGGPLGIDFFQAPRGYRNLLAGNNIHLTEISDYGPDYATSFFDHPFLAVVVGPWTAPLPPWTAFAAYDCVCVGLLVLGAWRLAAAFDDPLGKAFSYFAVLCGFPVYFLLWTGQMQLFVVLGVTLVLAGLMCLEQARALQAPPPAGSNSVCWFRCCRNRSWR